MLHTLETISREIKKKNLDASVSTLSRIQNGKITVTHEVFEALLEVLGIKHDAFLEMIDQCQHDRVRGIGEEILSVAFAHSIHSAPLVLVAALDHIKGFFRFSSLTDSYGNPVWI